MRNVYYRKRDLVNIVKAYLAEEKLVFDDAMNVGYSTEQFIRNFINRNSLTDRYLYSLAVEAALHKLKWPIYKAIIESEEEWNAWFGICPEEEWRVPYDDWDLSCDDDRIIRIINKRRNDSPPEDDARSHVDPLDVISDEDDNKNHENPAEFDFDDFDAPDDPALHQSNLAKTNSELMGSESAVAEIFKVPSQSVSTSWRADTPPQQQVQEEKNVENGINLVSNDSFFDPIQAPEQSLSNNVIKAVPPDTECGNVFAGAVSWFNEEDARDLNAMSNKVEEFTNQSVVQEAVQQNPESVEMEQNPPDAPIDLDESIGVDERRHSKEQRNEIAYSQVKWNSLKEFIESSFQMYEFDIENIIPDFEYGLNKIKGHLLQVLCPGCKISNHIFDEYLQVIAKEYPHCAVGSCCRAIPSVQDGFDEYLLEQKRHIRRYKFFIAPILKNDHFTTFVADMSKKFYFCYDSLTNDLRSIKNEIEDWKNYAQARFGCQLRPSSTIIFPSQNNAIDCGLYGCIYAEKKLRQCENTRLPKHARNQIIAELLNGKLFYENQTGYDSFTVESDDEEEIGECVKADRRRKRLLECEERLELVQMDNEKDFILTTFRACSICIQSSTVSPIQLVPSNEF